MQTKNIVACILLACFAAFLSFTTKEKSFATAALMPTVIDPVVYSFQINLTNYSKLKKTNDSLKVVMNSQSTTIASCMEKIAIQTQRQADIKTNKAKVSAKNVHKAKNTLTKEDKRNLRIYDSLLAQSKSEVAQLKQQQDIAATQLEQSKKNADLNKARLKIVVQALTEYAASIHGARAVSFQGTSYHIFVADLDSDELRMHLYNPADRNRNFYTIEAVKKYLESEKRTPLMITNAGMYISTYAPQGLYVENKSKTFFPLDTEQTHGDANFYLKPNGVFYLDARNVPHIDTTELLMRFTEVELHKFRAATQSGPMLVINGNIHRAFMPDSKNRKIRSGVGVIDGNNHKIVFAITKDETNFYNFASFFKDVFDCRNALFLDGAISQMYLPAIAPYDIAGSFGPMISVSRKKGK